MHQSLEELSVDKSLHEEHVQTVKKQLNDVSNFVQVRKCECWETASIVTYEYNCIIIVVLIVLFFHEAIVCVLLLTLQYWIGRLQYIISIQYIHLIITSILKISIKFSKDLGMSEKA